MTAAIAAVLLSGTAGCTKPAPLTTEQLRQKYGFSALAVNVFSVQEAWNDGHGKSSTFPWQDRYDRISAWLQGQSITPDVIALQEVYGRKICPLSTRAHAVDNETVLHLLSGLRTRLSADYRVASVTVRRGNQDALCDVLEGTAVVYNAGRLRNVTHSLARNPVAADDLEKVGFHARSSHPCDKPLPAHRDLCALIDGATFATSYIRSDGRQRLGPTLSIFELVAEPGKQLHIYNEHLEWSQPAAIDAINTAIDTGEGRLDNRLYPPILLGDFNKSASDMRDNALPDAGGPFGRFVEAAYLESDVMGILAGKSTAFPAQYPLTMLGARPMPSELRPVEAHPQEPLCSPIEEIWSDHCGVFARFAPE